MMCNWSIVLAAVVLLVMELRKGNEDYEAGGAAEQALGWSLLVINAIAIITLLSVFFMKQGAVRLLSSRRRVVPVSSDQIVELPSTQASSTWRGILSRRSRYSVRLTGSLQVRL